MAGDHNIVSKEKLDEDYISFVAGNFRTIRFGIWKLTAALR